MEPKSEAFEFRASVCARVTRLAAALLFLGCGGADLTQLPDEEYEAGLGDSHLLLPSSDVAKDCAIGQPDSRLLWRNVDDATSWTSDVASYVRSCNGADSAFHIVGFAGGPDRRVVEVSVRYRAGAPTGEGTSQVFLYQGTQLVGTGAVRSLSGSYGNFMERFSGLDLPNGNDLQVKVVFRNTKGSGHLAYSQLWLEVKTASPLAPGTGFVRAVGQKFVDERGYEIRFAGANTAVAPTEEEYARMKSWGWNWVRLVITWSKLEPTKGQYSAAYLSTIDQHVALAKQHGMKVVLDLHQYHWAPHFSWWGQPGTGLPDWAVSAYPNTAQGEVNARQDFFLNKGPNGTTASSTNPGMVDRFAALWRMLASRYKNEPAVAGYDLLNEPHFSTTTSQVLTFKMTASEFKNTYLPSVQNKAIAAIRSVDPNHLIAFEGTGGGPALVRPAPDDPNLFHYVNFYYGGRDPNYDPASWDKPMDYIESLSVKWNVPFAIKEFAPQYWSLDWCHAWLADVRALFETRKVPGWTYWLYGYGNAFGTMNDDGTVRPNAQYLMVE